MSPPPISKYPRRGERANSPRGGRSLLCCGDGHGADVPDLRRMMDNIKPDKEKSTEKIDGAAAAIMVLDRAIRCGNDTSASVYDSEAFCLSKRENISP